MTDPWLEKTANLSDVADPAASRANIGAAADTTTRSGAVQQAFDLLGAPPSVIPGPLYLTNVMTAAEITDVDTGAATIDLSGKINTLLAEADGRRDVRLPWDGIIRCDNPIGRTSVNGSTVFYPGTRLIGGPNTMLDTRVNNGALIRLDTTASNRFQDDIVLESLHIKGNRGGEAVGRDGLWMRRAYRARIEGVTFEGLSRGAHVAIEINDADGSNQVVFDGCWFQTCSKWGLDIDPIAGQNDLSYLTVTNCRFNACGANERAAITGISQGSVTTITTATAHGFSTGEYVTIYNAGLTLANELEHYTDQITVTSPTTYTINRATTLNPAYSGGATAMRQEPLSGSIRMKSQMGLVGVQTWITESQNVGLLIPHGGDGGSFKSGAEWFTVENCAGVPIIINAADGFRGRNLDLRNNEQAATSFAMVRLDASREVVRGVDIGGTTVIAFNPIGSQAPHIAFSAQDGASGELGAVNIHGTIFKDYSDTNHTRYGAGVFTASRPAVEEDGRVIFESAPYAKTTYTSGPQTYTPDIRKGRRHVIVLGSGYSGDLTIAAPPTFGVSGPARAGQELEILIVNQSGATRSLLYSFATQGAPTTIANGVNKLGRWMFEPAVGWIQAAVWI